MEEKEELETGGVSWNSLESEERKQTLRQKLSDAFREGIASARPGYDKGQNAEIPPLSQPPTGKDRQRSGDTRTRDRVIQDGGSAASVLYDKAAGALDSAVRPAKTAPGASTKWAEAFREGFASVGPREAGARKDRAPYSGDRQQSGDRGLMDRVLQAGGSAAEVVRGAVASVLPGEVRGAEKKIRAAEKDIRNLYFEIGREAVGSFSRGGPVETERMAELFDELRRNEQGIRNLKEYIAETVAARKAEAVRSRQAPIEAAATPASKEEEISSDAGFSGAMPDEQVEHPSNWQQPESPEAGDAAVPETPVSAAPEVESPDSPPAPTVDVETAPQEETSVEADQAPPEEPEASPEKTRDGDLSKNEQGV